MSDQIPVDFPEDLRPVIDAWPSLPNVIRARIVGIVEGVQAGKNE